MATKKITKKEMFEALLNKYDLTESEVAFIEHEIELLDKKNGSRKPTAAQVHNKVVAEDIIAYLTDTKEHLQIKEMIKKIPCLARIENCTTQYVVGVLRPYCEAKGDGTIKKEEIKGTSYFYIP